MHGFRPLWPRGIPRAGLTLLLATAWSVAFRGHPSRRGRRRRLLWMASTVYVALFTAVAVLGSSFLPLIVAVALPVAEVCVFYLLGAGMLLRAVTRPDRRVWCDDQASLLVTGRMVDAGTIEVRNLAAWPVGRGRSSRFLRELCALADREGWTLTGRANNLYLYRRLYAPLGFACTEEGARRPLIVRPPRTPDRWPSGDAPRSL